MEEEICDPGNFEVVHFDKPKKKYSNSSSFNDSSDVNNNTDNTVSDDQPRILFTTNNNSPVVPSSVNTKQKKHSVTSKNKEIPTPAINQQPKLQIPRKLSTAKHQQQQQRHQAEEDRKFLELERANQIKEQLPPLDDKLANQIDRQRYFNSTNQCKRNTGISQSNEQIDDSDQSKSTATSATLPRDDWSRCSSKRDILESTKGNETKVETVHRIISTIYKDFLAGHAYDLHYIRSHICLITDLILTRIKEEHVFKPCYRLVCILHIFEKQDQAIEVASRCCWDTERDNFIEFDFRNDNFSACCVVYFLNKD